MSEDSRSVVVTGASRGIGRAVASRLLRDGHRVAGISRRGDAPDGVLGLSADITNPSSLTDAITAAVQAHGPIEIVVPAAGIVEESLAVRTSPDSWRRLLETNLTATFAVVQEVLPTMVRQRWGRIVLISSVVAAIGSRSLTAYGASKGGIEGLTRSLAREVAGRGITVNAVAPGMIETDMTAGLTPAARQSYAASIPLGRFGQSDDVAGVISFLVSPDAAYITGVILGVDGGLGMGR